MRAAGADHLFDLAKAAARDRAPAPAWAGDAPDRCVSSSAATGAPIAAQSGRGIVARADQRLAQPAAGAPGRAIRRARSGAAAGATPDWRARSCRICRDADRRQVASRARDRRRRIATGRPCGPSARGRRAGNILKTHEVSFSTTLSRIPRGRAGPAQPSPPGTLQITEKLHERSGNTNVI